ncbi:MAG: efflux RND transporter permease subunit, partial [Alphaproteobacteria bacterium]
MAIPPQLTPPQSPRPRFAAPRNVATGLIAYLVGHRTAANLILCLMLLSGIYAATQLRAQFLPDIVLQSVDVSIGWPGAGPEDVDRIIVATVQPVLIAVEGVDATSAVAREGTASITIAFESGWDMSRAMDEVKAAVDSIRNLPDNTEEPVIRRNAWHDRVTDVVIHGSVGFDLLSRYAVEFQARLFEAGVTRTQLRGVADPVIRVAIPEARLIEHDLSLQAVADAIKSESEAEPAGDLGTGAARVRTGTERRSAEALGAIAIRSLADGSKLYLRDIANV